jgi:hypothetical protein
MILLNILFLYKMILLNILFLYKMILLNILFLYKMILLKHSPDKLIFFFLVYDTLQKVYDSLS